MRDLNAKTILMTQCSEHLCLFSATKQVFLLIKAAPVSTPYCF